MRKFNANSSIDASIAFQEFLISWEGPSGHGEKIEAVEKTEQWVSVDTADIESRIMCMMFDCPNS